MVEFSCIVIAGGESKRMGRDKRALKIDGKSFLEIALENAKKISGDVVVSLGDESQVAMLKDERYVLDEEKRRGPLFGLASTLKKCKKEFVALIPVDAPLLKIDIYSRMMSEIDRKRGIDAVVPLGPNGPEPLHGIYNIKKFLYACERVISMHGESVIKAVSLLDNVKFLKTEVFRDVDPKLLSFFNVNTNVELMRLKEILSGEKRS